MTLSINFGKIFTAFAVVLACVAPAAFVHADSLDLGGSFADSGFYTTPFDTGSSLGGSYADQGFYTTPYDTGSSLGGSYADQGFYTTPTSYDYGSGSYGGYSMPTSYFGGGSGFSGGGFVGGGGFGGGGSTFAPTTVSTYAPTTVTDNTYAPTTITDTTTVTDNGNTSVYAPTSYCTSPNSCNSSVDDHSIFNAPTTVTINSAAAPTQTQTQVVYQPAPQAYAYAQPSYPVYAPPVYQPSYPVYQPTYQQPIARAPYVTLSAVPYTGLDLGPMGTALYWSFLVLWCIAAAYLVAVKRIQNTLVQKLNAFLFSSPVQAPMARTSAPAAKAQATRSTPAVQEDGIDPFIQSQIAR